MTKSNFKPIISHPKEKKIRLDVLMTDISPPKNAKVYCCPQCQKEMVWRNIFDLACDGCEIVFYATLFRSRNQLDKDETVWRVQEKWPKEKFASLSGKTVEEMIEQVQRRMKLEAFE